MSSDKTGIQWTDATWNPVIGCRRVSEGCRNCYAEHQAARIVAMQRGRNARSPYEDVIRFKPTDDAFLGGSEAELRVHGAPEPKWNGRAVFLPERLDQPLRWKKPRMVFVNSMSDLFHEDITLEQIAAVFGVMAASPQHTFQVLTKRPERMLEFFKWLTDSAGGVGVGMSWLGYGYACQFGGWWGSGYDDDRAGIADWPLPNVWLGVSVEDQRTADERIPLLLQCPAAVRWVSAEPLLGPIDFIGGRINHFKAYKEPDEVTIILQGSPNYQRPGRGWVHFTGAYPDWVVVGGESGPGARTCDVAWIRSIVEQCRDAGVPCFVKQLGSLITNSKTVADGEPPGRLIDRKGGNIDEWPQDLRVREWPGVAR